MNGRQFYFGSSGNPLVQFLSLLVLALVAVVAVIMGAFVLLAFLGLAAIGIVVFSVRMWWLRRKLRARPPGEPQPEQPGQPQGTHLIEGEYVVIEVDEKRRSREGE